MCGGVGVLHEAEKENRSHPRPVKEDCEGVQILDMVPFIILDSGFALI